MLTPILIPLLTAMIGGLIGGAGMFILENNPYRKRGSNDSIVFLVSYFVAVMYGSTCGFLYGTDTFHFMVKYILGFSIIATLGSIGVLICNKK